MARGNQRDLAREKNVKRHADDNKGQRGDGLNHAAAKQTDAQRMQEKQAAAEARKNAGKE
jgi:hypothetical protein